MAGWLAVKLAAAPANMIKIITPMMPCRVSKKKRRKEKKKEGRKIAEAVAKLTD